MTFDEQLEQLLALEELKPLRKLHVDDYALACRILDSGGRVIAYDMSKPDAEFIVLSRNLMPELVRRYKRMEQVVSVAKEYMDSYSRSIDLTVTDLNESAKLHHEKRVCWIKLRQALTDIAEDGEKDG